MNDHQRRTLIEQKMENYIKKRYLLNSNRSKTTRR